MLAIDLPGPVSVPTNNLAACRAGSVLWDHASSRVPGDSKYLAQRSSLAHPHFLPFLPLSFPGPLIGPGHACFRAVSLWLLAQRDPKEHPAQETAGIKWLQYGQGLKAVSSGRLGETWCGWRWG